jgi:hypothetical protein
VIIQALSAMRRTIANMVPNDIDTVRRLLTITLSGDLTDFASRMAGADPIARINQQLASVLELVAKARN